MAQLFHGPVPYSWAIIHLYCLMKECDFYCLMEMFLDMRSWVHHSSRPWTTCPVSDYNKILKRKDHTMAILVKLWINLFVLLCSWAVGGVWWGREADAGGRPGEARVQNSHVYPVWHLWLQPSTRRSGLPRETRDDGGKSFVVKVLIVLYWERDP